MSVYETDSPLAEALGAIVGRCPPKCALGCRSIDELSDQELDELQQWASRWARPCWATGDGILEAAELLVQWAAAAENDNI
jgi:hypothetical protein